MSIPINELRRRLSAVLANPPTMRNENEPLMDKLAGASVAIDYLKHQSTVEPILIRWLKNAEQIVKQEHRAARRSTPCNCGVCITVIFPDTLDLCTSSELVFTEHGSDSLPEGGK